MMKNVGILTMHRPLNFGCALQAFATQYAIERLGYQSHIIDYLYPNASNDGKQSIKHSLFHWGNLILSFLFTGAAFWRRERRYNTFWSKMFRMTRSYQSEEMLRAHCPDFDLFCMGSDQIWNPNFTGRDLSFLGAFVPDGKKIFSYASSFGISELSDEQTKIYNKWLRRFAGLSVRERQGQIILERQLGLKAERVLDPTLLLNASEWEQLGTPFPVGVPYILCYGAEHDGLSLVDKAKQLVSHLCEENGKRYKIVHIHGRPWQRLSSKAHYTFDTGPEEFLSLIKNASCVFTTSYHGTCFSINFGIPFWSFVKRNSVDTRIPDLLDLLGLEKRLKHYEDEICEIDQLNADYINILESERRLSLEYLKQTLRFCCEE